jgi:hypothetical protein
MAKTLSEIDCYFFNNLKSVLFLLSKQIGIPLKSTALFLVKSVADKNSLRLLFKESRATLPGVDNQTILKGN